MGLGGVLRPFVVIQVYNGKPGLLRGCYMETPGDVVPGFYVGDLNALLAGGVIEAFFKKAAGCPPGDLSPEPDKSHPWESRSQSGQANLQTNSTGHSWQSCMASVWLFARLNTDQHAGRDTERFSRDLGRL